MDMQEHLLYITKLKVQDIHSPKIRGVVATWNEKENTACLSFYFDGKATGEELEDASVACSEIIAHCSNGLLEEHYIRWDYPKPIPQENLAYKREEDL